MASRPTTRQRQLRIACGLLGVWGIACAAPRDGVLATSEFVSMTSTGIGGERTLRLDAAPGARINAKLPPTLDLEAGQRITFTGDSLTADSTYFVRSPTALLGTSPARRGTLHASVCPAGLRVCLSVEMEVSLR